MMRRPRRPSTALKLGAISASLVAVAAWALIASFGASGTPSAGASANPASATSDAGTAASTRRLRVKLAAAPNDIALAQLSFAEAGSARLSERSLRVAIDGPFADDYMALAALRLANTDTQRALLLEVNRPSPLLDPVSVTLWLTAWRSLGVPAVRTSANAFARTNTAPRPALCDLRLHGAPLTGSEVSSLSTHGTPLAGFAATDAVAQAYDVACGLAYSSAFARAVQPTSAASPSPAPSEPTPSPAPPVGKLPGEGCTPSPGYACPLAVRSARSAARGAGARRAPAGAH